MSAPKWLIELGESGIGTKVYVGGVDITPSLSGLTLHCNAGELTRLELKAAPGKATAVLHAIVADVKVDGVQVIKDGEVVKP